MKIKDVELYLRLPIQSGFFQDWFNILKSVSVHFQKSYKYIIDLTMKRKPLLRLKATDISLLWNIK